MALAYPRVQEEAQAIEAVCNEMVSLLARLAQVLEHNADLAIGWTTMPLPAYITEDANGNLSGLKYSRTQVSNAIGSLDQVRKLMNNQAATTGDHLGNMNQLGRPLG